MLEIKSDYDKDPTNWHLLRGNDSQNHLTTFIAHDDKKLWQLKTVWKNPVTPLGLGKCVTRNLNDEICELMKKGNDIPIHEIYPNKDNFLIALGLGKYSKSSTDQLKEILHQDISNYTSKIEHELNLEFNKLIKKEQIFKHYI